VIGERLPGGPVSFHRSVPGLGAVMKVAVYGTGGVGGFFGGRLARSGVDVRFIARGSHLRTLRTQGLRVASVHGDFELRPVTATDDPAEIGPVDYVLVTVKSHHTDRVATQLGPLLHDRTAVVSLQNGVDNEEKLAAAVGEHRVVGGAAYIFATISRPGTIDHTGGPTSIVVGEWRGGRSERVGRLVEACQAAGFAAEETGDIRSTLWTKFAFICALAGTTAAIRLPIGEIRKAPASRELFRRVVAEVCDIARAEAIHLPADLPDRHLTFTDGLDPDGYSSLHHDLTHGHAMELDALLGEVVRRGARAQVATPMSEALYAVLQPWQLRSQA
jgi:2-dehydropantoate 2-reductase